MAMGVCPNCDKSIDIDGFVEHHPALFYCECGKIYDMREEFGKLIEVPKNEVDLSDIRNYPLSSSYYSSEWMSRGVFIKKERWKQKRGILKILRIK